MKIHVNVYLFPSFYPFPDFQLRFYHFSYQVATENILMLLLHSEVEI